MSVTFGTDGVRGIANDELSVELTLALGRAGARVLGAGPGSPFLVGRDTRRSGQLLEAALSAGLAAEGCNVESLGVVPTPAMAYMSQDAGAPAAMISASHNPFGDNGIKFFAAGGRKLADSVEAELELALHEFLHTPTIAGPTGADVGTVRRRRMGDANEPYVWHLVSTLEDRTLIGLKVVLDCANGAASTVAPEVLRALGADVTVIHARPDGVNINDHCGSTYPADLAATVVRLGADAGLAFDGDADRVMAVDASGTVVDGDEILVVCGIDMAARGLLPGNRLAATVMSNLGMRRALADAGISIVETKVGDRYVLEAIEEHGLALGGEQSGHVIFSRHATTGDGILTGIQLLDCVVRSGRSLAVLAATMTRYPQVLLNVRVRDRLALAEAGGFWDAVLSIEAELGESGRVLVRPSGTEPVVRVMVEAASEAAAGQAAARLADRLKADLGE